MTCWGMCVLAQCEERTMLEDADLCRPMQNEKLNGYDDARLAR